MGSIIIEIYGNLASLSFSNAADVFAICIKETIDSCILAPPLVEKHINGVLLAIAASTPWTNFVPTAPPMDPPM